MFSTATYIELLKKFPPRPINSEDELVSTQTVVDKLLDKPKLTQEEQEYLNVLGTLIYEYEQKQEEIADIYGLELLKVLMAERELKQKDLVSVFKTESIISDILNQKRQLTIQHIQKLAEFFNLSPAVFLPRTPTK